MDAIEGRSALGQSKYAVRDCRANKDSKVACPFDTKLTFGRRVRDASCTPVQDTSRARFPGGNLLSGVFRSACQTSVPATDPSARTLSALPFCWYLAEYWRQESRRNGGGSGCYQLLPFLQIPPLPDALTADGDSKARIRGNCTQATPKAQDVSPNPDVCSSPGIPRADPKDREVGRTKQTTGQSHRHAAPHRRRSNNESKE